MPAATSRIVELITPALLGIALAVGCSSQPDDGGKPAAGGTSGRGGATGSGGASSPGSGGSSAGSTGGATGSGGSTSGAGGSGAGGTSGGAGGGAAGGAGPGGSGGAGKDAGSTMEGGSAARPARVLIYTRRSTPTHDASIPVATKTLIDLFKSISIEAEASEAPAMFTASNLARFGAVVMVNSNGLPFGMPGTSEGMALAEFVRGGRGLAAFHAAANTQYAGSHPFIGLIGATFQNTGGGVRNVSCAPDGQHPAVAKVPTPLAAPMDETYVFGDLNPMNQVILRCDPASGAMKLPGSWVREEGAGRVFYTTLGHGPGAWTAGGPFVTTHAWPAILWVLDRAP